jgi:hypothetical protein
VKYDKKSRVENKAMKKRLKLLPAYDYVVHHRDLDYGPVLKILTSDGTSERKYLQTVGESLEIWRYRKSNGMNEGPMYGIYTDGMVWIFIFVDKQGNVYKKLLNMSTNKYVEKTTYEIFRLVHYVITQSLLEYKNLAAKH